MPILSKIFRTNLNITQSRNLNYKNVQLIQQNQKKQDEITYLRQITPEKYYPYIKLGRYEKQIGSILLFWPFAWGAASALTSFNLSLLATKLGYCYIASVTLRSAGCAINDYWDQDFDKKVERTKDRPLAKGELSFYQALGFCIANTIVGCGSLLQLGIYPLSIGLMATPFVILYPLMKRITNYP